MIEVNYTSNETRYTLSRALLFYTGGGETIATLHEICDRRFLAGKSLDLQDVDDLFHNYDRRSKMLLMPPQVVAYSHTEILWFEESRIRPIYFNVPGHEKNRLFLNKISGENVIWPNLLFRIAHNSIACWAVKGKNLPTADTPLYRAPFTNIFNDHRFCAPDALWSVPFNHIIDYVPIAVDIFYRGHFTHLYNSMEKRIAHCRGLDRFWSEMVENVAAGKMKTFPSRCLVPLKSTVRSILS